MKTIHSRHLGRSVKLGRKVPSAHLPRLHLRRYMRATTPPPSCSFAAKAVKSLSDIMGNDELGDCVIAAGYHVTGMETANAGREFHATPAQIIADYSAIGGYKPGNPSTDQGCDEVTALGYWSKHGFANGTKLAGFVAIDATDPSELRYAFWLFENLFFGFALPDKWVEDMPERDGFIWRPAGPANPENGHAFMATGYSAGGIAIDTWGLRGVLSYAAAMQYGSRTSYGECFALLSPDQISRATQKAPNGLDWNALRQDLATLQAHHP